MEAVRQVIDSDLLEGIIPLPKSFQCKKIEIIAFVREEWSAPQSFTNADIESMLKGSITESLIGILPQSDKALEDYRAERLNKYEAAD